MPRLEYTPSADAAYVWLRDDVPVYRTENLDGPRLIDHGEDGAPIGVELLDVSEDVNLDDLPVPDVIAALLAEKQIKVFA